MRDFLLKLLGVDAAQPGEDVSVEFFWSHGPQSWGVFVVLALAVAIVYGIFYLYRREITTCPPRKRLILGTIRAAVLALLIVVLMGPALGVTQLRYIQPHVLLLMDDSMSMSIRDSYADEAMRARVGAVAGRDGRAMADHPPSRAELIDTLLARNSHQWVKDLAARGKLRVMTFSNSVSLAGAQAARTPQTRPSDQPEAADNPIESLPRLSAAGTGTNLGKGLRESLRLVAGNPTAGVVLVTDGQNTEGDDPLSLAEAAVSQGVPIMVLGVGDPAEPKNLRVADLYAPDSVFRSDPFVIQSRIEGSGIGDASVTVELLMRSADAPDANSDKLVNRQTVRLVGGRANVSFEHAPPDAGQFIFTVRAPVQPGEQLTTDNARSAPVKVLSEKAKVLLIAGSPIWEYQMVRTLLTRDKTIDVSCWLQSLDDGMRQDGDVVINKLPATLQELLKYDVVVLMDPNPIEFDEPRIEMIRSFVRDHGGGLFWQAGAKYTHRFFSMPSTRGILELLPVRLSSDAGKTEPLDLTQAREWPIRLTASGTDHALLRLHRDPQISRSMFQSLPGVYWTYPVQDAKPGALALLEHTDPRLSMQGKNRPLLVSGQYGPGRTVFMGFDSSWRWRRMGEKQFDQFWVQAVRYLVEGRLLGGQHRGRISTDRDTYSIGEQIAVSAQLLGKDYKPLQQASVQATVKTAAGTSSVELKSLSGRPGRFEATLVASQLGAVEISVLLTDDASGKPIRIAKQLSVELPRVEFADPRLNRALLTEIANRTGGQYFEIDQADKLPAALPDRRETISIRGKPVELWDTNRLLLLLVTLLSVEWALRKYYKLL